MKDQHCALTVLVFVAVLLGSASVWRQAHAQQIYPAIFDEFEYSTAPSEGSVGDEPPSQRNLFGVNRWFTGPHSSAKIESRAWRRYNWSDNGTAGSYTFPAGKLRITIPKDTPAPLINGSKGMPMVRSGFTMGDGTYATWIRMSYIPIPPSNASSSSTNMMSAFWAITPGDVIISGTPYRSETDFEWNTWRHSGQNEHKMGINNHSTGNGANLGWLMMNCGAWDGSKNYAMPNCSPGYYSSVNESWDHRFLSIAERWMHLVFIVEQGKRTAWYLYSPGQGDVSYWGGRTTRYDKLPDWNMPYTTSSHVPIWDMSAVFSFHWKNPSPGDRLPSTVTIDAEYFYYSPHVYLNSDGSIALDELRQQIKLIRSTYRPLSTSDGLGLRVNTVGGEFFQKTDQHTSTPGKPRIIETPLQGALRWTIDPRHTGSKLDVVKWEYKTITCGGVTRGPFSIQKPSLQLSYNDLSQYWRIELAAKTRSQNSGGESLMATGSYWVDSCIPSKNGTKDSSDTSIVPPAYSLEHNYPNPFNPTTTIQFGLPNEAHVRLIIYDILGRKVDYLLDERREAGYHTVTWDAHNLPGGTYVYRLEADGWVKTRSMILLK